MVLTVLKTMRVMVGLAAGPKLEATVPRLPRRDRTDPDTGE